MSGVTCKGKQKARQKSGRDAGSRSWHSLRLKEVKAWPVSGTSTVVVFSNYESDRTYTCVPTPSGSNDFALVQECYHSI